jgi:hypothetical protein
MATANAALATKKIEKERMARLRSAWSIGSCCKDASTRILKKDEVVHGVFTSNIFFISKIMSFSSLSLGGAFEKRRVDVERGKR